MKHGKLLALSCSLVVLLTACEFHFPWEKDPGGDDPDDPEDSDKYVPGPKDAFKHDDLLTSGFITIDDSNFGIKNGTNNLIFHKNEDGTYGVQLKNSDNTVLISYNDTPAILRVRGPESGLIATFTETEFKAGYSEIIKKNYGYLAVSYVTTTAGSKFLFEDAYYVDYEKGVNLDRTVSVVTAVEKKDLGYSSVYSLYNGLNDKTIDDFEYFIPAILYKDTSNLPASAIANNLYLDRVYVKETRMGLPMSMFRNIDNGYFTSISHANPEISCNGLLGGGANGEIDERIQYGSFGFTMKTVSVDFCYPCAEGPVTYDCGASWAKRYHPVTVDKYHTYQLSIFGDNTESFNDAVVDSYEVGYGNIDSSYVKVSNRTAYLQNIDLFKNEYKEFGTGVTKSAGVPWELKLDKTKINREYSWEFGFVGMQSSVGAHLWREGLYSSDADLQQKGETIVNFWASSTINNNYFPVVWWDASNNTSGGTVRSYACYIRCMVDGMQGILDAYNYGVEFGVQKTQWLNVVKDFADKFIAKQNEDGSFYRAYNQNGTVAINASDNKLQGDSKLNTPIAIRFLYNMYQVTKDARYKDAALKAAEFSYTEIYEKLGKYVGGTPDNPNVVDKEAAVYALYGFRCAYDLSKDEKFKKAMLHAAVCSLSWTFVYDFACPGDTSVSAINPFEKEGHVIGFSVIATGHGASDNFSSWIWYDLYEAYRLTNISFLKDSAILIQHASKANTDYDGTMGYLYKCMMPEASQVSDFNFKSTEVWLPWSSVANINPIIDLYTHYGVWQIEDIK